jgi:tetratricopeptide (TPR) repeat protein
MGQADEAIESLQRMVNRLTRLHPETIHKKERLQSILETAWMSLLQFLRWEERHEEAIAVCAQVRNHLLDGHAADRRAASLVVDLGNVEEGLTQMEQVVQANPSLEAWTDLGAEYVALERYEAAVSAYKSAIKLATDNESAALANFGLFLAYRDAGRIEEALTAWSMVVVLDPEMGDQVSEVYVPLIERGELDRAVKYLDREPDPIRRTYYEGVVDWLREDEQAARAKWHRVLTMDVEQETADTAAWLLSAIRLEQPEEAIETGLHLLSHDPTLSDEASIALGTAYAMVNNLEEAKEWFERITARMRRRWPSQERVDARHWRLLTSVVSDEETLQSLASYFDTDAR